MDVTLVEFAPQPGFVNPAGAGTTQISRYQRSQVPHRKRLECRQHASTTLVSNVLQYLQVGFNAGTIDDETGRGYSPTIEFQKRIISH